MYVTGYNYICRIVIFYKCKSVKRTHLDVILLWKYNCGVMEVVCMKKRIFHGSSKIIKNPEFGYGKPYNDYGLGFYCTENLEMAKEWGVEKHRSGYANCYELDMDGLDVLDLNGGDYCTLHWISVLLENREFDVPSGLALEAKEYLLDVFAVDYRKYDIIRGYRADDSYFSFAQDFINGTISVRQLNNAMHLGKLGEQIVLKSRRAFEQIRFCGYEIAASDEWYAAKMLRDRTARREYFDVERNRRQKGDIYITHILDEEVKGDDPRLR